MAYRDDFMCDVRAVAYDFESRVGRLDMAPGVSCDMSGCIDFFLAFAPNARRIDTFAGGEPDTIYRRSRREGWQAFAPGDGSTLPPTTPQRHHRAAPRQIEQLVKHWNGRK